MVSICHRKVTEEQKKQCMENLEKFQALVSEKIKIVDKNEVTAILSAIPGVSTDLLNKG